MNELDKLNHAGIIAAGEGNIPLARVFFSRAIELDPENAVVQYNMGNTLRDLGDLEGAGIHYQNSLKKRPNHPATLNNYGLVLQELGRPDEAQASFEKAIGCDQSFADAHFNLGALFLNSERPKEAESALRATLKIKPDHTDALRQLASLFRSKKSYLEALNIANRLIEIVPADSAAYRERGLIQRELKQYQEALASFYESIRLDFDNYDTHLELASLLTLMFEDDSAQQVYEKMLEINPESNLVLGNLTHLKLKNCDWSNIQNYSARLIRALESGELATTPFALLSVTDSPNHMRLAARKYSEMLCVTEKRTNAPPLVHRSNRKIKLGYFSADFWAHATSMLMARLLELHDRQTFELIAFSMKNDQMDEYSSRIRASFDQFVDVEQMSDEEVAKLSRSMKIDIAIDLKGHTRDARTNIFFHRAAPIQINYLGYPGTMGCPFMDYIVADKVLIPENMQQFYDEKIIYLPNSYQPTDNIRAISEKNYLREELGLPTSGFVFSSFNYHYKITPFIFDIWCHLLENTPGSVLWLLVDTNNARENLISEAVKRHIDPKRIVFANRLPPAEHLSRMRQADLFLDTLPCNAHTTASDALWAGLPVLTCPGEAFHARVATSLLQAIGLPELSVDSIDKYIETALLLAHDPEKLEEIRIKLARNRDIEPLFNSKLYAENLEKAYQFVYERHQKGLRPENVYIN